MKILKSSIFWEIVLFLSVVIFFVAIVKFDQMKYVTLPLCIITGIVAGTLAYLEKRYSQLIVVIILTAIPIMVFFRI